MQVTGMKVLLKKLHNLSTCQTVVATQFNKIHSFALTIVIPLEQSEGIHHSWVPGWHQEQSSVEPGRDSTCREF